MHTHVHTGRDESSSLTTLCVRKDNAAATVISSGKVAHKSKGRKYSLEFRGCMLNNLFSSSQYFINSWGSVTNDHPYSVDSYLYTLHVFAVFETNPLAGNPVKGRDCSSRQSLRMQQNLMFQMLILILVFIHLFCSCQRLTWSLYFSVQL